MDTLGTRLGVLCPIVMGLLALPVLLALTGCAGEPDEPDVRTPPARELPSSSLGGLADQGAGGLTPP